MLVITEPPINRPVAEFVEVFSHLAGATPTTGVMRRPNRRIAHGFRYRTLHGKALAL